MSGVTDGDRERATGVVEQITGAPWDVFSDAEWSWVDAIAAALAEEREKARAQVAWDLRDLISDSGGEVWTRALLDFAEGLDAS